MRGFGLALLCLLAMSSQALAQYSLFTPKLFCCAVADAVAQRQAVALGTGEGKYDRYVSSAGGSPIPNLLGSLDDITAGVVVAYTFNWNGF